VDVFFSGRLDWEVRPLRPVFFLFFFSHSRGRTSPCGSCSQEVLLDFFSIAGSASSLFQITDEEAAPRTFFSENYPGVGIARSFLSQPSFSFLFPSCALSLRDSACSSTKKIHTSLFPALIAASIISAFRASFPTKQLPSFAMIKIVVPRYC